MKKYIIESKRTAIGKFLGSLYEANPFLVCVQLLNSVLAKAKTEDVQIGIFGNAIQAGMGQGFGKALMNKCGIPVTSPSYVVNMVCGSGAQAIINLCKEIELGVKLGVCGGYEFMSNIPFATNTYLRLGKKFGNFEMVDLMIKDGLTDFLSNVHMGITAENIAEQLGITREEQDQFAFLAQSRAIKAVDSGVFKDEITPISLVNYKNQEYVFSVDEFPNRESTIEKLSRLKPAFKKGGTVTAGNSSGINDGACFMLIGSEDYVVSNNIDPLAEIVDYVSIGCSNDTMGLGPYYAIKELLAKNRMSLEDIELFEINEAFSAQLLGTIKCLSKDFGVDANRLLSKTNVNGSGIGLGHPLGMSGARIVGTLAHQMKKNKCSGYAIASLCVGGGQGVALLLKGVNS